MIPKQHRNYFLEAVDDGDEKGKGTALIVLNNQSVLECRDLLDVVWGHCDMKICADGGANILYDMYVEKGSGEAKFLPNLIKGDLDSLDPRVGEYYESKGVSILKDDNQNTNDLDKCMESLMDYCVDKGKVSVSE